MAATSSMSGLFRSCWMGADSIPVIQRSVAVDSSVTMIVSSFSVACVSSEFVVPGE